MRLPRGLRGSEPANLETPKRSRQGIPARHWRSRLRAPLHITRSGLVSRSALGWHARPPSVILSEAKVLLFGSAAKHCPALILARLIWFSSPLFFRVSLTLPR